MAAAVLSDPEKVKYVPLNAQQRFTALQSGEIDVLARNTTNLGYTKIHAPMSGTVVSQTSLEGQTVNASQSAPVIVQIANLDTMTGRVFSNQKRRDCCSGFLNTTSKAFKLPLEW